MVVVELVEIIGLSFLWNPVVSVTRCERVALVLLCGEFCAIYRLNALTIGQFVQKKSIKHDLFRKLGHAYTTPRCFQSERLLLFGVVEV